MQPWSAWVVVSLHAMSWTFVCSNLITIMCLLCLPLEPTFASTLIPPLWQICKIHGDSTPIAHGSKQDV